MIFALLGIAGWCVIAGLWNHDWHLLVAGVAILAVWPLLSESVFEERSHERELDRLWDDE